MVPEAERGAAWHIEMLLSNMDSYVENFHAAISLFVIAKTPEALERTDRYTVAAWRRLAARDGAMTIYHFAKCFEAIKAACHAHPTITGLVDRELVRAATRLFNEKFSSCEEMRDSVAHVADKARPPESLDSHSLKGEHRIPGGLKTGPESSTFISGCFNGDTFMMTHEGYLLFYDVTEETLRSLEAVRDQMFQAFQPTSNVRRRTSNDLSPCSWARCGVCN